METLLHDLRYALRMMRKSPAFTVVAVLALALGIGANTAIFSLVEGFLLRPLPVRDSGRLMWVGEHSKQVPDMSISVPDLNDWQAQNTAFSGLAGLTFDDFSLIGRGRPQRLSGLVVTHNFFSVLGVNPELGRDFQASDDHTGAAPVVVISHRLWSERLGGDPRIVGKVLDLGGTDYTVAGVLPASFRLNLGVELFVPLHQHLDATLQQHRGDHPGIYAIGRLRPGITATQAQAAMSALAARMALEYPKTNTGNGAVVQPLRRFLTGQARPALLILMGAVGLVLLIACANLASLLLARSLLRQKEIAIRLALGAARRRLVRQLLTESTVLALTGGALGILLAEAGMRFLLALLPAHVPFANQVGINAPVLLFTLAVAVGTGMLFGLAPALQSTRGNLNRALVEGGRQAAGSSHHRLNNILMVGEVALALVLLVGAGLLLRSFHSLLEVSPGFNPRGVMTAVVNLPDSRYPKDAQQAAFFHQVLQHLEQLPGVESAGAITPLPFSLGGWQTSYAVEGQPRPAPGKAPETDIAMVSPAYFETMGVKLLRGRFFAPQDTATSQPVAIVDESFARRYWPGQNPIGQHIKVNTSDFGNASQPVLTVVGVVDHTMNYGLDGTRRIETYVPYLQKPVGFMTLVVRTRPGAAAGLAAEIRTVVQSVDPDQPVYDIQPMQKLVDQSLTTRRLALYLLAGLASLALLLAAIGLYGVISYSVTQRTHEIGIRMALGAGRGAVLRMVLRQGMQLAVLGIALGLVAGLLLSRTMGSLLYGVKSDDPITYGILAAALLFIALISAWLPAQRATRVDPMIALRGE